MTTISIILIAAACFTAAVLNLAVESRLRKRIISAFLSAAVMIGFCLYGYGYAHADGQGFVAVLHTIMAVCKMIGGANDLGSIESAPLFQKQWVIILFWAAHFMAFYATLGTAVAAFGGKMLRRVRMAFLRRGTLLMIYGTGPDAVEYGKRQMHVMHRSVVFIGQGDPALEASIHAAGGVLERNGDKPDAALLRRLGVRPGKRLIEIAALHKDGEKNLAFARYLLTEFQHIGLHPAQTRLLMREGDEEQAAALLATERQYGYGSAMAFDEYRLATRLMVQKLPPCDTISFDENARARENFHGLVIGFGRMGQAALNALLMHGQFCGSAFRLDIIDENPQNGVLHDQEILKEYDIRFHKFSGKSDAFYAFLDERKDDIRYIVLCTGSEKENREMARDMGQWLRERGAAPAIVQCSSHGLVFIRPGEKEQTYLSIYGSDELDLERIDRMAMAINHVYSRNTGKTAWENWQQCDYFSRMSCRASADFYRAVLRAAGKTEQQVEDGAWPPREEALENLSITEHMRWCAFHFVMGFHPMSNAEFDQRAALYRRELQEKGASTLRLGKNLEKRTHACLISWEELDALSEKESAIIGKPVDYQKMDQNNILVLPEILGIMHEMAE